MGEAEIANNDVITYTYPFVWYLEEKNGEADGELLDAIDGPGLQSIAKAINERGDIAGYSQSDGLLCASYWEIKFKDGLFQ